MKKIFNVLMAVVVCTALVAASAMASDAKAPETKSQVSSAKPMETKAEGSQAKPMDAKAKESTAKPAAEAMADSEAPAKAATSLEVIEIAIAKGIENREPVEVADKFPADVDRLYCYTKISGGKEGDVIKHRWKKGDEILAEVSLNVNGSPWRTYSSKAIMKEWTGLWTIEVLHGDTILKTKDFTIE